MCSTHRLTERNINVKFSENRPKGSGDMERTQFKDGLTDKGHSYKPTSALRRGDK